MLPVAAVANLTEAVGRVLFAHGDGVVQILRISNFLLQHLLRALQLFVHLDVRVVIPQRFFSKLLHVVLLVLDVIEQLLLLEILLMVFLHQRFGFLLEQGDLPLQIGDDFLQPRRVRGVFECLLSVLHGQRFVRDANLCELFAHLHFAFLDFFQRIARVRGVFFRHRRRNLGVGDFTLGFGHF